MDSRLIPSEPLSQVAFIHDYFQLVFQEEEICSEVVYGGVEVGD